MPYWTGTFLSHLYTLNQSFESSPRLGPLFSVTVRTPPPPLRMFGRQSDHHFCKVPQGVPCFLIHSITALIHNKDPTHLSHQTGHQHPIPAPKAASHTHNSCSPSPGLSGLSLRLSFTVSFPILPTGLSTAAPVLERCKTS